MTRPALFVLVLFAGLSAPAAAAPVRVTVAFDFVLDDLNDGGLFDDELVEGEATFVFEEDQVSTPIFNLVPSPFPIPIGFFGEFDLLSFSLISDAFPPNTFTSDDVGVRLERGPGQSPINQLLIGAKVGGITGSSFAANDFLVIIDDPFGTPEFNSAGADSVAGDFGFAEVGNVTVTSAVVPEPTTLLLAGLGGPAAWLVRRRRSA